MPAPSTEQVAEPVVAPPSTDSVPAPEPAPAVEQMGQAPVAISPPQPPLNPLSIIPFTGGDLYFIQSTNGYCRFRYEVFEIWQNNTASMELLIKGNWLADTQYYHATIHSEKKLPIHNQSDTTLATQIIMSDTTGALPASGFTQVYQITMDQLEPAKKYITKTIGSMLSETNNVICGSDNRQYKPMFYDQNESKTNWVDTTYIKTILESKDSSGKATYLIQTTAIPDPAIYQVFSRRTGAPPIKLTCIAPNDARRLDPDRSKYKVIYYNPPAQEAAEAPVAAHAHTAAPAIPTNTNGVGQIIGDGLLQVIIHHQATPRVSTYNDQTIPTATLQMIKTIEANNSGSALITFNNGYTSIGAITTDEFRISNSPASRQRTIDSPSAIIYRNPRPTAYDGTFFNTGTP